MSDKLKEIEEEAMNDIIKEKNNNKKGERNYFSDLKLE